MSEASERFYRRFARVYDLVFDKVMQPGRVAAIGAMELRPGQHVLEVGVGTGLNLPLYPPGVKVVGVDLSVPMLLKARRRARELEGLEVELREMDAESLDLPDDSFDHVYAPYVVSVVSDPAATMREMRRVCRPGGSIVVVNHFHSENALGAWLEKTFSPLTRHVGFRMDLRVERILSAPGLELRQNRKVNLFGMWRLIVLRKPEAVTPRARDGEVKMTVDFTVPDSPPPESSAPA